MKIVEEAGACVVRGIPLALLIAVLVQGGAAVWWVSAKARDTVFLEQRVSSLEVGLSHANSAQGESLQRLARIEERINAQSSLLERIDKQIGIHLK